RNIALQRHDEEAPDGRRDKGNRRKTNREQQTMPLVEAMGQERPANKHGSADEHRDCNAAQRLLGPKPRPYTGYDSDHHRPGVDIASLLPWDSFHGYHRLYY